MSTATAVKLSDKAREAKNEYFRQYRAAHRDKIRAYNREYMKKYRKENPEQQKRYYAEYWERRAEKDLQQLRECIETEPQPEREG